MEKRGLEIGKNWLIESDNMNIVLLKRVRRIGRDGIPYFDWTVQGYFATLKGALHELVNQEVRDTQLKDLKIIVKKLDELHVLIDNLELPPNIPSDFARQ